MKQRDRILKGAKELFFKAGIKSITMNDIASHLGISKKTIYHFFPDKNAIVHEITEKYVDHAKNILAVSNRDNAILAMLKMFKSSGAVFSNSYGVIFFDLKKYHPDSWMLFENFKSQVLIQNLEELLHKGISQGYVRPDIDIQILARLSIHEIEMGYNSNIFSQPNFSTAYVQYVLMEHFISGICTPKGHESLHQFKQLFKVD